MRPTVVRRRPARIPAPCPYRVAKGRESLIRILAALIVLTGCVYTWGENSELATANGEVMRHELAVQAREDARPHVRGGAAFSPSGNDMAAQVQDVGSEREGIQAAVAGFHASRIGDGE